MMKRLLSVAALTFAAAPLMAQIGTPTVYVPASDFAAAPSIRDIVVDSTGLIYAIDTVADEVVSIDASVSPATITTIATVADIFTEIDANNGTSAATAFNPRWIGLDTDGDVIVAGFLSGADGDSVVSITPGSPSTIDVVYTPQDANVSEILGIEGMTVLGTTAYVATSTGFGNDNAVFSIDTNATGPTATVTTVADEAALTAVSSLTGEDTSLNDLSNDGTNVFGILSKTGAASDDILQVTPSVSVYVADSDITADLAAVEAATTDMGYSAIGLDGDGDVWLLNPFGDGPYDAGVVEVENVSAPNGDAQGLTGADLDAAIGSSGAFLGNDSLAYDSANDQMLFYEGDVDGIIAIPASGTVSSVSDWQLHQ